jgi:hypothetical protein
MTRGQKAAKTAMFTIPVNIAMPGYSPPLPAGRRAGGEEPPSASVSSVLVLVHAAGHSGGAERAPVIYWAAVSSDE